MKSVKMRFALSLGDNYEPGWGPNGALFHRFLPNGEDDAIALTPSGTELGISVWFERRTEITPSGFLQWKRDGGQFDEGIMRRQGKLDSGPLFGSLVVSDVTDEAMSAMLENPKKMGTSLASKTPPSLLTTVRWVSV